jgi:hypothetical protein
MWTRHNKVLAVGMGVVLLGLAFWAGRKSESSTLGAAQAATGAPTLSVVPSATTRVSSASLKDLAVPTPTAYADLSTRLAAERANRPNVRPTSDAVFSALETQLGVKLEQRMQVAAWMVEARFCEKVRTTNDIHVVVCEFPDEAAAIRGQELGKSKVPNRVVLRNKATTCAVHQPGDAPASAAEAQKIKDLFAKL